jgi:hypothetical protein
MVLDANDAAAICEAVSRPSMRFVAIKTKEQHAASSPAIGHDAAASVDRVRCTSLAFNWRPASRLFASSTKSMIGPSGTIPVGLMAVWLS